MQFIAVALVASAAIASAQAPASIASKTTGFERRDGFVPVYLESRGGRILLEQVEGHGARPFHALARNPVASSRIRIDASGIYADPGCAGKNARRPSRDLQPG